MRQKANNPQHDSPSRRVISVPLGQQSYQIIVGTDLVRRAGKLIQSVLGQEAWCVALISNRTIFERYGPKLTQSLSAAGFRTITHLMGDGERYKNLRTVEQIYHTLAHHHLDRQCAVVAFGGGVVGDVAGFVAASFLRGIAFIQMPTTLLAAIDSSIGGKTGVNLREGKNLVGAFHQPRLVITDVSLLDSLPRRERKAALYEALKYGILADPELFEFIVKGVNRMAPLVGDRLVELIARCCQIKADVVAADEREVGWRQVLNLGHTFGHALEAVTNYRQFKHGEAVGYGMLFATQLASGLGLIEASEAQKIESAVWSVGRLPSVSDLDAQALLDAMRHDKKARRHQLTFILPTRIGSVKIATAVPDHLVRATIKQFLRSPSR